MPKRAVSKRAVVAVKTQSYSELNSVKLNVPDSMQKGRLTFVAKKMDDFGESGYSEN